MIIKNFKISAIAAAVIAGSAMLPSTALFAQEMVEEIITLGARAKARSATGSVAPVDVINASGDKVIDTFLV